MLGSLYRYHFLSCLCSNVSDVSTDVVVVMPIGRVSHIDCSGLDITTVGSFSSTLFFFENCLLPPGFASNTMGSKTFFGFALIFYFIDIVMLFV